MMLADVIKVARRFQRSIRVDRDIDSPSALDGFVYHESNRNVLETMASLIDRSNQRAFTWTGPYGVGKSSLALALATMVSRDVEKRKQILNRIDPPDTLRQAFPTEGDNWLVVPVTGGHKRDPVHEIRRTVSSAISAEPGRARTNRRRTDPSGRDVLGRLEDEAGIRATGGVLLIIDEMGKFLESAGNDIHFFQELAEAANRCEGRLIVIGILHQSFERYADRHGRATRNEWAKIQGRFVDIPIVTAVDEVIDLIGNAVECDPELRSGRMYGDTVAKAIKSRRPGSPPDLAARLDACWPLHPVTVSLLGPVSRSGFAQNERSVFGFLGSGEPLGFQEFLNDTQAVSGEMFGPDRLWDYLRANLEPAIMASQDGHRWAQGVDSIERCEAKGSCLHVRLAKTVAVIDLFRNGSGVMAERSVIGSCSGPAKVREVDAALRDLSAWSVVVYRNHIDAWAIHAGSDFDINFAVESARARNADLDYGRLGRLALMPPLLAKEHYYQTGTLRWFDTGIAALSNCENSVAEFRPYRGAEGGFLLVIPSEDDTGRRCRGICEDASRMAGDYPVAVGIPDNAGLLHGLGLELNALDDVRRNSPELEGDAVARREIRERLANASTRFEEELRKAFFATGWYIDGELHKSGDERSLSILVSDLATRAFCETPIIHSEMINRARPSANIQAAVRQLLYRMVDGADRPYLGIEGFRAERALYSTVLQKAGLHGDRNGKFGFRVPHRWHGVGKSFVPIWKKARELLESAKEPVSAASLQAIWSRPPFGVRHGVLPVLTMAFILSQRKSIAVYVDGMFQHEINDLCADKLLQDAGQISLRHVDISHKGRSYLKDLAKVIGERTGKIPRPDALSVAREMVHFCFAQPAWTRRTKKLSERAKKVRQVLLHASDPHQALFIDLPMILDGNVRSQISWNLSTLLREIEDAYPEMLQDLQRRMLESLDHGSGDDLARLRERAGTVSGLSGDFRLDAFATRLTRFEGSIEDMESIASLAVNKPPRDWSDRDPEQAAIVLADFSLKFRHAEVLAWVKGRDPTRQALGIVIGTGKRGHTIMRSFDVGVEDEEEVEALADRMMSGLNGGVSNSHLILAALARLGSSLLAQEESEGGIADGSGNG